MPVGPSNLTAKPGEGRVSGRPSDLRPLGPPLDPGAAALGRGGSAAGRRKGAGNARPGRMGSTRATPGI